jgi:3',5'-cyclic AMP phosphodiesterase CpdA
MTYPRIILLSDLHCGAEGVTTQSALSYFYKIAEDIKHQVSRLGTKHCVLITGDLVDSTFERKAFNRVVSIIKDLDQHEYIETFVIPGNHDYLYMGFMDIGGDKYIQSMTDTWDVCFFKDQPKKWPKYRIIEGANEENLHIVGLNSMLGELERGERRDLHEGYLGKEQRDNLDNLLDNLKDTPGKKIIALHHHPFKVAGSDSILDDRNELIEIFKKYSIDALLFGHQHTFYNYTSPASRPSELNGCSIDKIYCASSATGKKHFFVSNQGIHHPILDFNDGKVDFPDNIFGQSFRLMSLYPAVSGAVNEMSVLEYDSLVEKANPGDVISFGGVDIVADVIKFGTNSMVSHSAVILDVNNKTNQEITLLEAMVRPNGSLFSAKVRKTSLYHYVKDFQGYLWHHSLSNENFEKFKKLDIDKILKKVLGKDYNYDLEVIMAGVDLFDSCPGLINSYNVENSDKFFCSELITFIYKEAGILPESLNSSEVSPGDLAAFKIYNEQYNLLINGFLKEALERAYEKEKRDYLLIHTNVNPDRIKVTKLEEFKIASTDRVIRKMKRFNTIPPEIWCDIQPSKMMGSSFNADELLEIYDMLST